ncbi:hypothetical protein [Chamaesiphon sp. VAR_48_metabat_135_sub]|uniref:hypothetical protein n=1 Tax=Chamaesiphon sp. VAR_48_metabat_135_sub TaxID=2964699 RepID=UPI00286C5CC7|nr:hypothetical protein [Chamaesiphon sp. VAR_48_metabat_135_sub]
MSKLAPSHHLLYLMLRAQKIARTDSTEGGYAMMFVSIVTVMLFSLVAASLTITNISRSATNAYTEGSSTFYAAESGLNRRSDDVRQKFINYATPDGVSPGNVAGQIAGPENMAACLDANLANDGSGDFSCQKLDFNYRQSTGTTVSKDAGGTSLASDYNNIIKYTAYTFASDRTNYIDPIRRIPQVQPIPAGQAYAGLNAQEYRYTIYSMATSKQPGDLDARAMTVLEMTFKSRNIPLFQFAAFYNGDLEMNSTSQMDINGRVHSNANLYIQPTPYGSETTRLLGQVTAAHSIYNRVDASTNTNTGITQVLLTGDPNNPGDPSNVYEPFPATDLGGRFTPLTPGEINAFQHKILDGAAGAAPLQVPQPGFLRKRDPDGEIGEYYGKADLRLEMMPKRALGTVPFNFAAIKTAGTGGSCSGFEISTGRQGTINCTQLNEGQLRSLSQPVMAKVVSNEERTRFCPSVAVNHNPGSNNERKILRALQVAIAAQNTPVSLTQLNSALSDPANANIRSIATSLKSLNTSKSPATLAGEVGACFLPAPIQVVTDTANGTTNIAGANSNYSWTSGHFDRREGRWIGMLQTNIGSLTVWNRDGLYVDRDDNLNSVDLTNTTQQNSAFNSGNNGSAYDTNNLLFVRSAPKPTAPTGSFQKLGLGSNDNSEGGLVYHATVSDDLDGDGTPDITVDPVDKLRNYTDGKKKSSYGFTFSGGKDLPAPLTIVTDRALYIQGDYNNFLANAGKQPAALIGDTITVLSNNCLDDTNFPPTSGYGMVNCGVETITKDGSETTVNAAFLSYTDESNGNSTGTSTLPTPKKYSGGLNNYVRMVEDWGGKPFNYAGSFISLGAPQEYSGEYVSGSGTNEAFAPGASYYNVPIRNFKYDVDFNAFDRLPPLTPKVIYLQQETFKRSYK